MAAGVVDDPVAYTDPEAYLRQRIASMEQRRGMPRDVAFSAERSGSQAPCTPRTLFGRIKFPAALPNPRGGR